jgi:phosphoribosylformylglycinamidine synthase I
MKFGIVTFPCSNCDYDSYHAVADALGLPAVYLWHKSTDLQGVDVVILPGGVRSGDYPRAGAIARYSPIMQEVAAHARAGGPVLGICNGFQIACEAGLLPGALLRNANLQFVSDMVRIRVENADTMFTTRCEQGDVLRIPVAHGDGRFTADEDTLDRLEGDGRVVFRYVNEHGAPAASANPNGSMRDIAGIISAEGNVLGLMPHPERAMEDLIGSADGRRIFESLLARVSA